VDSKVVFTALNIR